LPGRLPGLPTDLPGGSFGLRADFPGDAPGLPGFVADLPGGGLGSFGFTAGFAGAGFGRAWAAPERGPEPASAGGTARSSGTSAHSSAPAEREKAVERMDLGRVGRAPRAEALQVAAIAWGTAHPISPGGARSTRISRRRHREAPASAHRPAR